MTGSICRWICVPFKTRLSYPAVAGVARVGYCGRMNITEFAEQIVFGKTLAEKLRAPERLSYDSKAGSRIVRSVRQPGRPVGMEMQLSDVSMVAPTRDCQLENDRARGKLLHFLANHELLATELMALVLVKFPDAPIAFRRGVLVTLQEEQEHTRMYLRRMAECGVELGSYPLSGQFWKIVEPMESPMDFVARLSLTFEQANLDYSRHFAKVFHQIGDEGTSAVLQQVYEDEIGHVRHGLEWFRQWKNPSESDWEAYQRSLEFPMSPQRARGPNIEFNRDGRQRAGLDDEFIDAIEVFRQSRGKAATLRWFDPGAESELAGQRSSKELALLEQLGTDLEYAMVPMSKPDDILLVRRLPSRQLRKHWIDSGLSMPEFQLYEERNELTDRRLHNFGPWAWTPKNHELVSELLSVVRHHPAGWDSRHASLFRKSWAAGRLKTWMSTSVTAGQAIVKSFVEPEAIGELVDCFEDARELIGRLKHEGYREALVKPDLATSGRGQRRIACRVPLLPRDEAWLVETFRAGPSLVEPLLDKVLDLSFLWRLDRGKEDATFLGWTRPIVTEGRRYAGARLGDSFGECEVDLRKFLLGDRCKCLKQVAKWLQQYLVRDLLAVGFEGAFGVDALVCRSIEGGLKIKPLVELNPRTTMGHVALAIEKHLAPGVSGEFRILSQGECEMQKQRFDSTPIETNTSGQWTSGVLRLSEFLPDAKLFPVVVLSSCCKRM